MSHILLKCRRFLPKHILVLLFNAIGLAHIYYGDVVYLYACNKKLFSQIESRYVDCGRIILFNRRGSSRSKTLTSLSWLPLMHNLIYHMLIFIFKVFTNQTPSHLYDKLPKPSHHHNTRHSKHNILVPSIRTQKDKKSFTFWGPHFWNILPPKLKECQTLSVFDKNLCPQIENIFNKL